MVGSISVEINASFVICNSCYLILSFEYKVLDSKILVKHKFLIFDA